MKIPESFIIIDDDPLNNKLCEFLIKRSVPDAEVMLFSKVKTALEYFDMQEEGKRARIPMVILVNINMPELSGWDFIEKYHASFTGIKEQTYMYIMSASVSRTDKLKALQNPYIRQYFVKPFTAANITTIIIDCNS